MSLPLSFFYIFAFIFGTVIGSFLNVCICRLPEGKSIAFPPSACPLCGNQIRWFDNIPIVSILMLKAKCRACHAPISWRYPLVEALNGLLTLLLFIRFGPTLPFLVLFAFCSSLVVITFIDLEHQIIPDEISVSGIVVGFLASLLLSGYSWPESVVGLLVGGGSILLLFFGFHRQAGSEESGKSERRQLLEVIGCSLPAISSGLYFYPQYRQQFWPGSLLGIMLGGGIIWIIAETYYFLRKEHGMGGGDIKLLAMMGAFLGWRSVPFIIFAASLVGSVIGVAVMMIKKKDGKLAIPFGPFLAFGAVLYIFYGPQLIDWYFSLGR